MNEAPPYRTTPKIVSVIERIDESTTFCQTLTIADVDTGWVYLHGLKNKAQRWTHAALECARRELPIPIKGIDTDNGMGTCRTGRLAIATLPPGGEVGSSAHRR